MDRVREFSLIKSERSIALVRKVRWYKAIALPSSPSSLSLSLVPFSSLPKLSIYKCRECREIRGQNSVCKTLSAFSRPRRTLHIILEHRSRYNSALTVIFLHLFTSFFFLCLCFRRLPMAETKPTRRPRTYTAGSKRWTEKM